MRCQKRRIPPPSSLPTSTAPLTLSPFPTAETDRFLLLFRRRRRRTVIMVPVGCSSSHKNRSELRGERERERQWTYFLALFPLSDFAVFRFVFRSSGSAGLYPKIPLPFPFSPPLHDEILPPLDFRGGRNPLPSALKMTSTRRSFPPPSERGSNFWRRNKSPRLINFSHYTPPLLQTLGNEYLSTHQFPTATSSK